MDAARTFLLEHWPGTDPVWLGGEEHGEHRLDVFHLAPVGSLFVIALCIDGMFVPEAVSERPHVPYDPALVDAKPPCETARGVFAWVEDIHSAGATEARFVQCGRERTAPVVADRCVLFDWDTPWPSYDRCCPRPLALRLGGAWVPTVSCLVAATAEDFRRGYSTYCDGERDDDWAPGAFHETGFFAEKLRIVECLVDDPDLSDFAHGCLAAGPVEDLIGHALLDHVMASGQNRQRWLPLLRQTYWTSEPPDIRQRLSDILGVPDGRSTPS